MSFILNPVSNKQYGTIFYNRTVSKFIKNIDPAVSVTATIVPYLFALIFVIEFL